MILHFYNIEEDRNATPGEIGKLILNAYVNGTGEAEINLDRGPYAEPCPFRITVVSE